MQIYAFLKKKSLTDKCNLKKINMCNIKDPIFERYWFLPVNGEFCSAMNSAFLPEFSEKSTLDFIFFNLSFPE